VRRAAACAGIPWTEIDGMPHWDGGIVDNTPLGLAIDAFSADATSTACSW